MSKVPGIMLYLENLEPIRQLPREEQGDLLIAILEYGRDGTLPRFEGMLAMAWAFVLPKIRRDMDKYQEITSRKRYGPYCREAVNRGDTPVSYAAWGQMTEEQQHQLISGDVSRYPTTSASATKSATASAPASTATTGHDHRYSRVRLSSFEMDVLRRKIEESALDGYLRRLDTMIRTDPTFDGNHYLTILGWWSQGV